MSRGLPKLLSPTHAAQALGVSTTWVRYLADRGTIRCIRDSSGRRALYAEDVERLRREQGGKRMRNER